MNYEPDMELIASDGATIVYKDIAGFPGYRVGNDGTVWTRYRRGGRGKGGRGSGMILGNEWKQMKPQWTGRNLTHLNVMLSKGGKQYHHYVHHLVLEAFVGPRPDGMQACHNDGNACNNTPQNLRWDTIASNRRDAVRHGTHGTLTHSDDAVLEIRKLQAQGMRQCDIVRKVGLPQTYVSAVMRGKIRNHVQPEASQ